MRPSKSPAVSSAAQADIFMFLKKAKKDSAADRANHLERNSWRDEAELIVIFSILTPKAGMAANFSIFKVKSGDINSFFQSALDNIRGEKQI